MTRYTVHNVVGAKTTGYITRDVLEGFLEKRYPAAEYPGAATNRFEIKVHGNHCKTLMRGLTNMSGDM